jgi:hypothetical protein
VKIFTVIIFGGGAVEVGVDGGGTGAGVSSGLLQAVSSASAQMHPTTPPHGGRIDLLLSVARHGGNAIQNFENLLPKLGRIVATVWPRRPTARRRPRWRKVGVGYATVARIAEPTKRLQRAGTGADPGIICTNGSERVTP